MADSDGKYVSLAPLACAEPGDASAAAAGRELIVVNKLAGRVQFFDRATRLPLAEIEMERYPHEVVLAPDGRKAYVSIYGLGVFGRNTESPGRSVAVIDLAARRQVRMIDVSPYRAPHGMAFDGEGILWVSCDVSGVVLAIDPAAGTILEAVATNSFGTHWIAACPARGKLYATNKNFPFVCVIDARARRLVATIPFPEGSEGLALSPDGGRLYVAAQRPQMLAVIDTASDRIVDRVPLDRFAPTPEGRNPQKRVRVSPDGRWLLLTSFNTGEIAIAPCEDPRSQTLIQVGKGPMGITFADADTAYVMNHDQGSISLVDVPGRRVVARFETAPGPETLAIY